MGRRIIVAVIVVGCLLVGSYAFAEEKIHSFAMGTEATYIKFKDSSQAVKEKGMLYGIYGTYTFKPQTENWLTKVINVFKVGAHFDYGTPNYIGDGDRADVKDYLFEPRLLLGKDLQMGGAIVTPYSGFGYRYFFSDGKASTGFADDKYQYLYLPIGFSVVKDLENGWKLGGTLEYDFLLKGYYDQALSDLSDSSFTYTDVKNTYKSGNGVRLAINLEKKAAGIDWIISPYASYWSIGKSDTATYSVNGVPFTYQDGKNSMLELGLRMGMKF
ncbi:MAG: autotransporter domain-containing protein [Candidatus Omnitrophica bacterium]|nr:autotransporter domain-containing protein [Candidatus Omnitrophota bacterium]